MTQYPLVPITQGQELACFFDLGPYLRFVASTDGSFLRTNTNLTQWLGPTVGRQFLDQIHPEDLAIAVAALAEMHSTGQSVLVRTRYCAATGNAPWVEWTLQPDPDEGRIFGVGRNVADGVALERELAARSRREAAILDNTVAVVYVKSPDGRYEFINQRFARLFQVTPEGVVGKTDYEIFPHEIADMFQKNDRQVAETRRTCTLQEVVPHDDGPHTYISVKFPLFDGEGNVSAVAGISTDITDQLRIREADSQLRFAQLFQQKLYPSRPPAIHGLDIAGGALPVAQVCGDYFDYILRNESSLIVTVGDVSGHGYGPALQMVEVRAMLRMLLREPGTLASAANELNQHLCADLPPYSFVSLFVAEIDAPRRRFRYIGAGHHAVLMSPDRVEIQQSTATLMGIATETYFEPTDWIPLRLGDVLLAFTDGLTELMDMQGEQFGGQRLLEAARGQFFETAEDILRAVFAAAFAFGAGRTIQDDMTAVAVRLIA